MARAERARRNAAASAELARDALVALERRDYEVAAQLLMSARQKAELAKAESRPARSAA